MLDGGVDINYGDVDNTSALVVAIMNKQYTFAKFLIDRGADVERRRWLRAHGAVRHRRHPERGLVHAAEPKDGRSAAEPGDRQGAAGSRRERERSRSPANLPGRSGMDSGDTTLAAGTTPLMRAARAGDAAVMRLLLEKGADPKLTTKDGNTALMFAAGVGYRDKNTRGTRARCAGGGEDTRRGRPRPAVRRTTAARPRCTAPRTAAPTPSCSFSSIAAPI